MLVAQTLRHRRRDKCGSPGLDQPLWIILYDLKLLGDDLWEIATASKLEKFSKQLKETTTEKEKASLINRRLSLYGNLWEFYHVFQSTK